MDLRHAAVWFCSWSGVLLIWERNLGGPRAGPGVTEPHQTLLMCVGSCNAGWRRARRAGACTVAILAPQWPDALNASEILIERRLAGPPPGCCPWAIAAAHWHSTPGIIAATARRGAPQVAAPPCGTH
jgi:hypothetical protein